MTLPMQFLVWMLATFVATSLISRLCNRKLPPSPLSSSLAANEVFQQVFAWHTHTHTGVSFFRNPKLVVFLWGPFTATKKGTLEKKDTPTLLQTWFFSNKPAKIPDLKQYVIKMEHVPHFCAAVMLGPGWVVLHPKLFRLLGSGHTLLGLFLQGSHKDILHV